MMATAKIDAEPSATNSESEYVSYLLCLQIVKASEPPATGESFLLPAIKKVFEIMYDDKSALKEIETIPLSDNTVLCRINEMSQWVQDLLIQRVGESKYFSLQLFQSTEGGLCQLLVFIRYIWNNEPQEDILCCETIMHNTSEEIFSTLDTCVKKNGLDWMRCVGICTDGAHPMCGKPSSVVTRVLKVCPNASWSHCSIQRELFVSKSMSDNLKNVLNASIKLVNFIKSGRFPSFFFEEMCNEMGRTHEPLLFLTEACWLSRGKVLTRLLEFRGEAALFLDEESDLAVKLHDKEFVLELAYLADIFSKLNELNLYLQETEGADIFAVHDKIQDFIQKLVLWKKNIEDQKYGCFETFEAFIIENEVTLSDGIITEISAHLNTLKENFEYYFFEQMENCQQKNWIANPFQPNMTTGISTKADEELSSLAKDQTLKLKFNRGKLIQFWLAVQQKCPTLSTEALKLLLLFPSSHICEVGFSAMLGLIHNFMNDGFKNLSNYLHLQITNIDVDIDAIISSNQNQAHPSHNGSF